MKTPAAWWRSVRRRKPGWYLYRTRRHLRRGTEWGYGGKSRHLPSRDRDHRGYGRWGQIEKPWADLIVRRYTVTIPWWLGWWWVLGPVEALMILTFRPRYNSQLNPRHDKCRPRQQELERQTRDATPAVQIARIERTNMYFTFVKAGAVVLLLGIGGWLWQR